MFTLPPALRRWGARALVLCLVPLVWLSSTPEIASAATTVDVVTIEVDATGLINGVDCEFGLSIQPVSGGSALRVGNGGFCMGGAGPNLPGFCAPLGPDCSSGTFTVMDPYFEPCGSAPLDFISTTGFIEPMTTFGAMSIFIGDCDPQEVCFDAVTTQRFGGDITYHGCVQTELDPTDPLPQTGQCVDGSTMEPPSATFFKKLDNAEYDWNSMHHRYDGRATIGPGASPIESGWIFYAIYGGSDLGVESTTPGGDGVRYRYMQYSVAQTPGGVARLEVSEGVTGSGIATPRAQQLLETNKLIGIGGWRKQPGWSPKIPTDQDRTGQVGITDMASCSFYWGRKLTDLSHTDTDTPIGPVPDPNQPPPVIDEPPAVDPPVVDDPDSGFDWMWLVYLLGRLFQTVVDAISGLVSAIVTGIKGLLIPDDPNAVRKSVNNMRDAFDGRFPFSLVDSVETMNAPSGAGSWTGSARCPDWRIKVSSDGAGGSMDKSIMCDSEFTVLIRGARGAILAAMLALAFWPLIRSVFYASIPIISPAPGGGK